MFNILKQLKQRRLDLGLKQHDISAKTGISRQQYQRIESKGNPRLDTLQLMAAAVDAKVVLIPNEQLHSIAHILNPEHRKANHLSDEEHAEFIANPWKGILEDDE
jgi:transcriptional regulator with XRE-family HTH domain